MKIHCGCGNIIVDNTDSLRHKAYFIADQDLEDVLYPEDETAEEGEAPAAVLERVRDRLSKWSRPMWQCRECGSLYVDDREGRAHRFQPVSADVPRDLLASIHGEQWKRPMRGSWRTDRTQGPPGELWWGGGEDSGFERFDSWEELERRYHTVFERLRDKNVLRDAMLCHGERCVHRWPSGSPGAA